MQTREMLPSLLAKVTIALATSVFYGAVRDCGGGVAIFHLNRATIDPAKPVSGKNLTLYIEYTVPDSVIVTGGTSQYDVTYNYIPFKPAVEPLCQDIPCPLGPGTYTNSSVSLWPSDISGMLSMKIKWFDPTNVLLQCVEISGQVGDPRQVAVSVPWIRMRREAAKVSRVQKAADRH